MDEFLRKLQLELQTREISPAEKLLIGLHKQAACYKLIATELKSISTYETSAANRADLCNEGHKLYLATYETLSAFEEKLDRDWNK